MMVIMIATETHELKKKRDSKEEKTLITDLSSRRNSIRDGREFHF
jgi:hypothetical protein